MSKKSFLIDDDLPAILELLKTKTFSQVAVIYGYDISIRNGGCGIRNFLKHHGYDPRDFSKGYKKTPKTSWYDQEAEINVPKPKILRVEYENGVKVTFYEPRHARF